MALALPSTYGVRKPPVLNTTATAPALTTSATGTTAVTTGTRVPSYDTPVNTNVTVSPEAGQMLQRPTAPPPPNATLTSPERAGTTTSIFDGRTVTPNPITVPGAPTAPTDPYADINSMIGSAKEEQAKTSADQQAATAAAGDKAKSDLAAYQEQAASSLKGIGEEQLAATQQAGASFQQQLADLIASTQSGMSTQIGEAKGDLTAQQQASKDYMASLYDDMLSTNDQMREQMVAQGQLQLGNFLRRNSSIAAQAGQGIGSAFLSGQRQALTSGMNAMNQAQLQAMQQRMGVMGQRAGALGGLESQGLGLYAGLTGQGLGMQGNLLGQGLGMQGSGAGTAFGANVGAIGQNAQAQQGLVGAGFQGQAHLGSQDMAALQAALAQGAGAQTAINQQGLGMQAEERAAVRDAEATALANEAESNQKVRDSLVNNYLKQFFGPSATLDNLQGKQIENLTAAQQAILDMILEYQKTGDPELKKRIDAQAASSRDATATATEDVAVVRDSSGNVVDTSERG